MYTFNDEQTYHVRIFTYLYFHFIEQIRDVFAKHSQPHQAPQKSKDDAYAEFMKEMEQIMK